MTVQYDIRITGNIYTKRGHAKVMREVLREAMQHQAEVFWPKHFQNVPETFPGAGGYAFARRSQRWNEFKRKRYGHVLPNVATGRLRTTVLGNPLVRGTQHRASVTSRGEVGGSGLVPNERRREIEVVSNRERRELASLVRKRYVDLANDPRFHDQIRRRSRT